MIWGKSGLEKYIIGYINENKKLCLAETELLSKDLNQATGSYMETVD